MSTPEPTDPIPETNPHKDKPIISQLPLSDLKRNDDTAGNSLLKDLLVKLESKFEPLKGYFSSVNAVLDQHSKTLNEIQRDNKAKVAREDYLEDFERLAFNSRMKDEDLYRMFSGLIGPVCRETDDNGENNPVNMLCNRMAIFVNGFSYFHRMHKEVVQRLDKIESEMPKKMSDSFGKQKLKQQKRKLKDQIKNESTALHTRVSELEQQLSEKIDPMQEKLLEVEKQTLWRIRDCEDLLKSRVSGSYIDDQVVKIEQRLKSEISRTTLGSAEEVAKTVKGAIGKLEESEKVSNEKYGQFKEKLRELESFIANKVEMSKLEEFQKLLYARSDSTLDEVRTLTRRYEPAMEKVEGTLKTIVENLNKNISGLKDVSVLVENYMLSGGARHKTSYYEENELDENEVSGAQAVLRGYKEKIDQLEDMMVKMQGGLNDKVSTERFENELKRRAERLETQHSNTEEVPVQVEDRSNMKFMRNIEELQHKLNRLETDWEMKMIKLKREMDVGNIGNITKALKQKADEAKVQSSFETMETKIESILETFHLLKKELDQSSAILQKISVQAFKFGDKTQNSSKGLNTQACLSCSQTNFPMLAIQGANANERKRVKHETEADATIIHENLNTSDIKEYGYNYTTDLNGSMDSKLAHRPPSHSRSLSRGSPLLGPRVKVLTKPNVVNLFNFSNKSMQAPSFVRSNSTYSK